MGRRSIVNGVSAFGADRIQFDFELDGVRYYGYKDRPEKHNPAVGLKCLRITKKDRPVVDPFTIVEAESLIAQLCADWGNAIGNYDELRFFTGLRPSEQIALLVTDFD
jgi:hypothetical protein